MTIDLGVMPTEPAQPTPGRRRGDKRWRWMVAGTLAVVTGAAALAVALGSPPPPPEPPAPVELDGRLGWVEELIDAPPRGTLATDEGFVRELTERVTQLVRTDTYHRHLVGVDNRMHSDQDVRLIYADDIGDRRIVLFALRLAAPWSPTTEESHWIGRTRIVWLSGPLGTPANALASVFDDRRPPGMLAGSIYASPLLVATVGDSIWSGDGWSTGCAPGAACTMVALTPPGCTIATATGRNPDAFREEPAGSYLIRTSATYQFERWRVTCDGVVREERQAPQMWQPDLSFGEDVSAALDQVADLPVDDWVEEALRTHTSLSVYDMQMMTGLPSTGLARVLWAGRPPDETPDPAATEVTSLALIVAGPSLSDTWLATYQIAERHGPDGMSYTSDAFVLDGDPTAPGHLLAILSPYGGDAERIVAIPPPAATALRFTDPDTGAITEFSIADGLAHLRLADATYLPGLEEGQVTAVDATGTVIAANVAASRIRYDAIHAWD